MRVGAVKSAEIWTMHGKGQPATDVEVRELGARLPKRVRASRAASQVAFALLTARRLRGEAKHFDVVITVDSPTGAAYLGRLAKTRNKSLTTIAWVVDLYYAEPLGPGRAAAVEARLRHTIDLAALERADEVVTLGSCMIDRLRKEGLTRALKQIPIWGSMSASSSVLTARDRETATALRKNWGLYDRFVVLYSGHAGHRHDLHTLVQAAAASQETEPDVVYLVVGGGEKFAEARAEAEALQLTNLVFRTPVARDDVAALLHMADVHLASLNVSSLGTCVPSKAYSAMAAGKPLIFVGPGTSQVALDVATHGAGVVVEPGDWQRLLTAVRQLQDSDIRLACASRAELFQIEHRSLAAATHAWSALLVRPG